MQCCLIVYIPAACKCSVSCENKNPVYFGPGDLNREDQIAELEGRSGSDFTEARPKVDYETNIDVRCLLARDGRRKGVI